MGPIFRYVAHFIEHSVENWKPVTFRKNFIQSEKLTVNFRLESDFLHSFSLCRTKNVAQWPILLSKKSPPGCAKLENFGFGKQMVDCQPSNEYPKHMFFMEN